MNEKKGEVYFRDVHGNFHKLSTSDFNDELDELTNLDSVITSKTFSKLICRYKPFTYNNLNLLDIKKGNIVNNQLNLSKGLYRFSVFLSISSKFNQKIYFFFRDKKIISNSLQIDKVYNNVPTNLNFNLILNFEHLNNLLECSIISEKELDSIESYILYYKIN
tara:strand:- start:206 stop:694 length:489 start_codon:yes stop_codon:yes gene_type:complete